MRKIFGEIIIVSLFTAVIGCSSPSWSPSDNEAVELVKRFYYFFDKGLPVEAKIVHRGDYLSQYQCFPIDFLVTDSQTGKSRTETFFFFRNEFNEIEINNTQYHSVGLSLKKIRNRKVL